MIDLYLKYLDEQIFNNNHQDSQRQRLISTPDSSTEIQPTYDSTIRIAQPSQPNNIPRSVDLSNVAHSDEAGHNVQQGNTVQDDTPDLENKINVSAALIALVIYASSISLIVYGCIHLKDCPAANMITISYIVIGCLLLLSRIISSPEDCRDIFRKERDPEFNPQMLCRMCLNLLVQIAIICFFIIVCYWAFYIKPDTTLGSPNYCEKEFYKNTWYGCIVALSLLGLMLGLVCCGCCILICKSS